MGEHHPKIKTDVIRNAGIELVQPLFSVTKKRSERQITVSSVLIGLSVLDAFETEKVSECRLYHGDEKVGRDHVIIFPICYERPVEHPFVLQSK